MHRQHLLTLFDRYAAAWPEELALVDAFREFVTRHDDCLHRRCVPGHITASAWILSADGGSALLTHHKKLGKWLQLGGHVDGEPQVERAALREAQEESGMQDFEFVTWRSSGIEPLDLDVHPIPQRGDEPLHRHWDVRFLLRARPGQQLVMSGESTRLQWFPRQALPTDEESVVRLERKAARHVG